MQNFSRITLDPQVMGGKPCIRGMRVTVGTVVGLIAAGKNIEEVLAEYPYLEREDVLQALSYAAWRTGSALSFLMKILIDMNLPPRWMQVFNQAGWEAVHWSHLGAPNASDWDVMKWARGNGYIVFTHDLDFSAMLRPPC